MECRFKAGRRHHPCKVACVAVRAYDSRKLVHAADAHANSHCRVDMRDELGRVGAACPRALVEQNEHWSPERHARMRRCTEAAQSWLRSHATVVALGKLVDVGREGERCARLFALRDENIAINELLGERQSARVE